MREEYIQATLKVTALKTDVLGTEYVISCPLLDLHTFGIVILLLRLLALQQAFSVTSLVSGVTPFKLHSIVAAGLASSDKHTMSTLLPRVAYVSGSTVADMSLALTEKNIITDTIMCFDIFHMYTIGKGNTTKTFCFKSRRFTKDKG